MTKRDAISSEVAEGFARDQGVDRPRRTIAHVQWFSAQQRLLGKGLEEPGAFSVVAIVRPVGVSPPLLSHIDLGMRNRLVRGPTRQVGKPEKISGDLAGWMAVGQEGGKSRGGASQHADLRRA